MLRGQTIYWLENEVNFIHDIHIEDMYRMIYLNFHGKIYLESPLRRQEL